MPTIMFVTIVSLFLAGGLVYLSKVVLKKDSVQKCIQNHVVLQPNSICWVRVYLAGAAMIIYGYGWDYLGIAIYLLSVFLDAVDGMVARACDLITAEGERLDPFCDKISYLIPIIYFCIVGQLNVSIVIAFVIIELSGQYLVREVLTKLNWSIASNNFGKIKAVLAFSLAPYLGSLSLMGYPKILKILKR